MTAKYSYFPSEEFARRFSAARKKLRENSLAACLVIAPEHLYYFAGYDSWVSVNSPQVLIFTSEEDVPTLLVRDVDVPLAMETAWVSDVRSYNLITERFADVVLGILREKGIRQGALAIELSSYALPAAIADELRKTLAPMTLTDATDLLGDLRHIKSDNEMQYMRAAGRYANQGLQAFTENLTEGISEIELSAFIEYAMRRAGCDYWAIPVELASGHRSACGHGTPREKLIEPGDLVHAEFAGVEKRYHATAIQTIACGEPGAEARELYDIGIASLQAGIDAVKPGVAVAEVEEASLVPLRAHGLESAAMMRFGYGVGIAYPPIWLETLQIARGFDFALQQGMAFVLHSCLELPEEELGVIQGGTWGITDQGLGLIAGAGVCGLVVC